MEVYAAFHNMLKRNKFPYEIDTALQFHPISDSPPNPETPVTSQLEPQRVNVVTRARDALFTEELGELGGSWVLTTVVGPWQTPSYFHFRDPALPRIVTAFFLRGFLSYRACDGPSWRNPPRGGPPGGSSAASMLAVAWQTRTNSKVSMAGRLPISCNIGRIWRGERKLRHHHHQQQVWPNLMDLRPGHGALRNDNL